MEEWKDVIGFENKYSVSNYGRLLNKITNHIYKLTNKNGDYIRVVLYDNKHKETRLIHRMVATAFLPNPNNLPEIDHIDFNKQNNNVNNLIWVTRKENIRHNITNKRFFFIAEYNKQKVWKDIIYQFDKNMNFIAKYTNSSIAEKETGVCRRNILQCCNHDKKRKTAGGYKWLYESEVV